MKLYLLAVVYSLMASGACGAAEQAIQSIPQSTLVSSSSQTCIIDDKGVNCWGYNWGKRKPMKNPTKIFPLSDTTCALGDEGLKCWGRDWKTVDHLNVVPIKFKNLRQLTGRGPFRCALDDNGVQCWGPNNLKQIQFPPMTNPIQLGSGGNHSCALDQTVDGNKVVCWGYDGSFAGRARINPPPLKNPRQISVGTGITCALDDIGVKCWGATGDDLAWTGWIDWRYQPGLKNPRLVAAGDVIACALDDEGVKCWEKHGNFLTGTEKAKVTHPRFISAGGDSVCALGDEGVRCAHTLGGEAGSYPSVWQPPELINPR